MARQYFGIEKGLDIYAENGVLKARVLFTDVAPTGTGDQAAAPIGSLLLRTDGSLYQKVANSGNAADWQLNGSSSATVGKWRGEQVVLATNDTQAPGVRDVVANPFSDDEGTAVPLADYQVGRYIIADADGTPALLEITNVAGNNVTFAAAAAPLAEDDTFVVKHYLPDSPADQEGQAIINYNGSVMVKIGDIDWNFADGIAMAAGYTAGSGDITSADTVQSAIQKLDGNNDDQDTLLGTSQGDTDLGTFPGATIPDSSTVKGALSALESAHEEVDQNVNDLITLSGMPENSVDLGTFTGDIISDNTTVKGALQEVETELVDTRDNVDDLILLSGVAENSQNLGAFTGFGAILLTATETVKSAIQKIADFLGHLRSVEVTGVTTEASVDEVPVASYGACKWLVLAFEEATPANRQAIEVYAINDGTAADDTQYAKLKLGANFNLTLSVDVSGGNMRLRAASSTAGVTVRARRLGVVDI